jgi:hypothetical protein
MPVARRRWLLLLLLHAPGPPGLPPRLADAETQNYCADVKEGQQWYGGDIKWQNKSNHWFPATISTCCASCHNQQQLVPGGPPCVGWVWGHNNNADCQKSDHKEGEGCCWPKRQADDSNERSSKTQTSGRCSDALHSGGIPTDSVSSWVLVAACLVVVALYAGGGVYIGKKRGLKTHVHIVQLRQLYGLVIDGCAFVRGGMRTPPSSAARTGGASTADTEASLLKGGRGGGGGNSPSSSPSAPEAAQASRGRPGPLHDAASRGDAAALRRLLRALTQQQAGGDGGSPSALDAGDEHGKTPYVVACAGGLRLSVAGFFMIRTEAVTEILLRFS